MGPEIEFIPDEPNQYAPPSVSVKAPSNETESFDLRLFLQWERFRLLYNLILGVVTIFVLIFTSPRGNERLNMVLRYLGLLLAFAMLNVFFCCGLVLDGYARLLGLQHSAVSRVIFAFGTIFAAIILAFALGMRGPD
jgi:hypothetical protein